MRILLVEDDAHLAESVRRGLVAEGFAVDVASDGSEGLWLAMETGYDAIVCDVLLPGIDGYGVCRGLREARVWTPVLMLTALTAEADETTALDTGADDFLTKPFSYQVLLAHLRALVRRGGRERPAVLVAGDLRLDPAAHRVWRGEQEIALSPRQFSLLELLMRRQGDVVSKAQALEHVWDFAYDGDPNIVEVYVGQLRRKVDQPYRRCSITTVRGAGYRLEPDGG